MEMISNRPYLLRAFYDWIVDSQCTPVLVADSQHPHCKVPSDYVQDNEIVFNISPTAVRDLDISNTHIQFRASFHGVVHVISIPIGAILALYADENNEGLFFDSAEDTTTNTIADTETTTSYAFSSFNKPYQEEPTAASHSHDESQAIKGKPSLRLVEVD